MLNDKVLEDGTRYNFNLLAGGGLEIDFSSAMDYVVRHTIGTFF